MNFIPVNKATALQLRTAVGRFLPPELRTSTDVRALREALVHHLKGVNNVYPKPLPVWRKSLIDSLAKVFHASRRKDASLGCIRLTVGLHQHITLNTVRVLLTRACLSSGYVPFGENNFPCLRTKVPEFYVALDGMSKYRVRIVLAGSESKRQILIFS